MIVTKHPRYRVPAVMAIGGSVIAVASLIGSGWGSAVAVEVVTVLATIGYYLLGGRDSDLGAVFGSRPDERQAGVETRAMVLAGLASVVTAVLGFVIALAVGSTVWPFELFCIVGAVAYVSGLLIYRRGR